MTYQRLIFRLMKTLSVLLLLAQYASAQGYDTPLAVQGLDHTVSQSAASRSAGGTTFGIQNDPSLMFLNPSLLQSLSGIKISIGGLRKYRSSSQIQEYAPLKYYSNFSLLMENRTGPIPDPKDTVRVGSFPNAGDTVQRPYDNIGPDWSRTKNSWMPAQALLAIPVTFGENRFTIGLGFVRYADLNYYYQNNNVLSPSMLSVRPYPMIRPTDQLPQIVEWSQHITSRDGYINGYGIALAGSPFNNLSLGVSAMLLKGNSDDIESYVGRGKLTFYFSYFRLDSVYDHYTSVGTSDYSGQEYTLSGVYRGKYLTLGFSVKPPMTITRDFQAGVQIDTTGASALTLVSGQDKLELPWRGTLGVAITVRQDLTLGLEYEIHPYASAVYKSPDGTESNPWLSGSVFHLGAEYVPASWLAIRAGLRGQAEVFQPEGNPVEGDPVSYSVYSAGCGLLIGDVHLNLSYEYALMKYDDTWSSAVSRNRGSFNSLFADIAYDIPLSW